ncbi:MAG: adenylate/guanylate cyclase domain-containing protein [Actinomycetota bacterium]|nr:adenylate/guanylate cyclase domain-containing protein [Actinomycetota bacterium]
MSDPAPPPAPEPSEAWLEVVDDRLGRDGTPARRDVTAVRRLTRARRGRLLELLSVLARRGRDPGGELDPDVVSLLELIGLDASQRVDSAREFAAMVDRGEAAGLDRSALPHVLQAYVRAVSRIVAVEAGVALEALRGVEADRRAEVIGRMIDALLPASLRGFDLLHRAMLQDALLEASDVVTATASDFENMAVGMVDLVRSTDYLSRASAEDLEKLVDAIFAAGQAATSERAAHIVKYVGDGVFIAANDVGSVADAALDAIERLEAVLPLRARGGVSYGFVVQRAGDVFGLPVNLAQALTKAARPGKVLLSAEAAALIGSQRRGRLRPCHLPHPALEEQRVATLRPAAEP